MTGRSRSWRAALGAVLAVLLLATATVAAPPALEVNGLSDVGVKLEVVRKGPKAPITAVSIAWWKKAGDDYRAALKERQRSKIGRLARLRGTVEKLT